MKKFRKELAIDLEFVQKLLRKAGRIAIKQQPELTYQLKVDDSLVTRVDKEIETLLIGKILKLYPDHGVISEERGVIKGANKYTWVIDPLDGTRVYYGGLPIWGIAVGIISHDKPECGVFYLPKLDEMYAGTKKRSYLNGHKMLPVVPQDIDGPTTFLAVPSQCHILFDVDVKRLRSLGSLAAHLAYVARGSAVGALTQHASLWDIAAMMPILESVGIKGQYLSGEELRLSDLVDRPSMKPLVFAHSRIIDDICKRISLK